MDEVKGQRVKFQQGAATRSVRKWRYRSAQSASWRASQGRCDCMCFRNTGRAGAPHTCRPIGALLMEDENGVDEKIIAVPVDELESVLR